MCVGYSGVLTGTHTYLAIDGYTYATVVVLSSTAVDVQGSLCECVAA